MGKRTNVFKYIIKIYLNMMDVQCFKSGKGKVLWSMHGHNHSTHSLFLKPSTSLPRIMLQLVMAPVQSKKMQLLAEVANRCSLINHACSEAYFL